MVWPRDCHSLVSASIPRSSVELGNLIYYQNLAVRAGEIDSERGLQGLWKEIKAVLPKQQSKRKNNTVCRQPPQTEMLAHFSKLEAGEPISFEALAGQCRDSQQSRFQTVMNVEDAGSLPDRLTIERLCMKVHRHKAPGLDTIAPQIVKDNASVVGKAMTDLFLKMWILQSEPVMWKGGKLFPLWKGSGSRSDPTKYRGIVLLSVLGKRWHAFLRQKIIPHAEIGRLPSQFGGFPMQQPGFATSTVRTFAMVCKAYGVNDACIYFDIRSAFHHLLRQLAMDLPNQNLPAILQSTLEQDGFSTEALARRIGDPNQLGKLPLPHPLDKLVADLHQFAWFSTCESTPIWTHRGTRPGSPYADLGFNAFMGQLMVGIREMLYEQRSFEEACNITGLEPIVVGWVDDIAIPLAAVTPQDLCDLIVTVTEKVLSIMRQAGLQINMDRGKTECIATFRGKGAPGMRQQVFVQEQGVLPVPVYTQDGQCNTQFLHLVGKYVHLGTCMAQEQNFDLEIRRRIGIAQSAFRTLARPIFRNRRISCQSRLQLLESLICTKLFYNIGPWPLLRPGRLRRLEHVVMGWQRQIIGQGFWKNERITDADVQQQWLLPSIDVRFAMSRLRFALAAHKASKSTVWHLIKVEAESCSSPWFDLLVSALRWFGEIIPAFVPKGMDLNSPTVADVENWFEGPRRPTKAAVKRCLRKHLLQEQVIGEVRRNYGRVIHLFDVKGRIAHPPDAPLQVHGRFACNLCPAVFPRAQQLQAHKWSKHSAISIERQYADGATCRACGRHFWTPQRVQQHLRMSRHIPNGCLEKLFRHVLPHDVPQPSVIPNHLKHIRRLPPIQIVEPMSDVGPNLHEARQQQLWEDWCSRWESLGLPHVPPKDMLKDFCELLTDVTHRWAGGLDDRKGDILELWVGAFRDFVRGCSCTDHMLEWLFILWHHDTLPGLTGQWDDPDAILQVEAESYELLKQFVVYDVWQARDAVGAPPPKLPPLLGDGTAPTKICRSTDIWTAFSHQTQYLEDVTKPPLIQPACSPPVGCIRGAKGESILVIVHLFSGRRREGDVHDWISRMAPSILPGWEVWVLSFDTAVDVVRGNLIGPNFEMLLALATEGLIAGGLGGPPCETFSAARHLPPPENCKKRWPRPLRSEERLWGVEGLSMKELTQLRVGTQLYFHCNLIEFAIALNGGVTMEEHPASSGVPGQASSWQSALNTHFAKGLEHAWPIRIDQWRFGASSVKPTVLRVIGAPQARFEIWKYTDPHAIRPKSTAQLRGVDACTGEFKTAGAKEYPAGLSRAMAMVLLKELHAKIRSGSVQFWDASSIPEKVEWLRDMHVYSAQIRADATRLPDYQG